MTGNDVEYVKKRLEGDWKEAREYIESGGDATYAFLNLARKDIENIVSLIEDGYCRRQVEGEKKLLDHALNLAMMAFEWSLGVGGFKYRVKLVLKALKEIVIIFWLQLSKI